MIKSIIGLISIVSIFFAGLLVVGVDVNVCHRTGSNTNPYNLIVVSVHSVNDANGLSGHGGHAEDGWKSFVFDGITYSGQNEGLFGSLIDDECNLIPLPTSTATPTLTPTATDTPTFIPTSTSTSTFTATPTETRTNTPTATSTATSTVVNPSPTATGTLEPSLTPTAFTPTPTVYPTESPIPTMTTPPTFPPSPTSTIVPTETATPRPPEPAVASNKDVYPGSLLGIMYANKTSYLIYNGVNANDGSLLLPSNVKAGALYDNQIWLHRVWNSGWFKLTKGEIVKIIWADETQIYYKVDGSTTQPYGKYFDDGTFHIVTCYGATGTWNGVEVFNLTPTK